MSIPLLIHADCGARSGFVGALLTDTLTKVSFDVGRELGTRFLKIHELKNVDEVKLFDGIKIRIRPTYSLIDLLSLLFLRKNVYAMIPDFTKNEYSLETFTKLTRFSEELFQWDAALDNSLYDYVFDFDDTFDVDTMAKLYTSVTTKPLDSNTIDIINQTNIVNRIPIDKNHACSIMKMVLNRELELGLKEENRYWSIVDVYNATPVEKLYDTVYNSIKPENYST